MKAGASNPAGVRWRARRSIVLVAGLVVAALVSLIAILPLGLATSGGDPYEIPAIVDEDPAANGIIETTLIADEATVDIGNGVTANAQTFNGAIPGPTFRLNVGDTVIVHYENHLDKDSGIHWHGVELPNGMDGTPFTQNMVPPGGSFLYKFTVTRPGIFWYHPHHHASTNQVFKGLYGMIIVQDPNEQALRDTGVLPAPDQTKPIVLSDTTVCKTPGTNDAATYNPALPFVGGGALPAQAAPTPLNLCEGPAVGADPYPVDENGNLRGDFAAGDIPNIQTLDHAGRVNEGQTVLTNGKNVGARAGSPSAPGALAPGAETLDVRPGQGLRLQFLNASAVRYLRLRLTSPAGVLIPLRRVGGEAGLLDNAVTEGGLQGAFDTKYTSGEILMPPGTRADVVAAIPSAPTSGVLTLWTEDYSRTGLGFSNIPTVPVMHLNLAGSTVTPAYTIPDGTPLRAATGDPVEALGPATGNLLNPAAFPTPKTGLPAQNIKLQQNGTEAQVDGVFGTHDVAGDYSDALHLGSSRYVEEDDIVQLTVENTTNAHHPFHLHGFSIQPLTLTRPANPTYTWPYKEFRDNVDIPPLYTLTYRVRIDPRPLADGTTQGGAKGRWLFHCHIFHHATDGMLSELVVTDSNGNERPDVDANTSGVEVTQGDTATMTGTYNDRDGDPVTLSASVGTVTDTGGGNWSWTYPTTGENTKLVYVTATDSKDLKGQTAFDLEINDVVPTIKKLKVVPNKIKAKGQSKLAKKAGKAKIKFKLSEPATVKFKAKRIKPKKPKAKKKFTKSFDSAGKQKTKFKVKLGHKALPPGKYKLTAKATDRAGLKSKKASKNFKIVEG